MKDKKKGENMKSIELLLEEYKIVAEISEKYFDRMYLTINFVLIYYGAILTIVFTKNNKYEFNIFMFTYFLPVGTYILGLLYAYNSLVLARVGLHSIEIEKLIIAYGTFENNQKCFLGWNIRSKSKKYNGHFILSYGTVLMFFILSPICDFFIAYELNDSKWFINYFNMKLLNTSINVGQFVFYIIYMMFMLIIIMNCKKIGRETNEKIRGYYL